MRIHGLEPRQGETAFAFLVLRFTQPAARDALVDVVRQFAPIIPDVDAFLEELPTDETGEPFRLLGMPWTPPEAGSDVDLQRRLVEASAVHGVEEAWFFQCGTSLPSLDDDDEDDEDDEDDDSSFGDDELHLTGLDAEAYVEQSVDQSDDPSADPDAYSDDGSEGTQPVQIYPAPGTDDEELADAEDEDDEDDEDEDEDDEDAEDEDDDDDGDYGDDEDEEAAWSQGPPPVATSVRFPVDGYPAIIEELDWEDVGIAFKLAGPAQGGESTVLVGFHALWLSPYGGRHRNAAITIDRLHHSAHLWVDRFAVPSSPAEQVGHLLWILSRLDEIVPVVHARFAGATMQQKYGAMMGDTSEPFVLGGNPLLAVYAEGGEQAVDPWIDTQTDWSPEEVAQMLRELAIEIVTSGDDEDGDDESADELDEAEAVDALFEDDEDEDDEDGDDAVRTTRMPTLQVSDADEEDAEDEETAPGDDGDDDDEDDEDDEDGGEDDEDNSRYIARYATEILVARAQAGLLDTRAATALRPVLATAERYEHRRTRVAQILGAARDRGSVPDLIRVLETSAIKTMTESITKEDLLAETSTALGAIGDPAAIPALSAVIAQPGAYADDPRAPAAHALAACLAASPEPRDVSDVVVDAMLRTIADRNDGELVAELHFAYGKLAQVVSPARREHLRARLASSSAGREATPPVARAAALAMAGEPGLDALREGLHRALGSVDYNHDYTVRSVRFALRVAELFPSLVDPADLAWLARFDEPDIRAATHALLDKLGAPLPVAPAFDPTNVGRLGDAELLALLGEPHVVGRAALVAEAGRRALPAARPAILAVANVVIERARPHGELLEPDSRLLEAAVIALRTGALDADTIALFDRMLRHANPQVKWELLQDPPDDDRLIGGMFVVLAAKWGWQHSTAVEWLTAREGSPAFEEERKRAGVTTLASDADDADDDGKDDDSDDGAMN